MDTHIQTTRRHLGELGALAAKTEASERDILARAEKRMVDIEQQIVDLRPTALQHPDTPAAQQYMDAMQERGRLHTVIASSRSFLSESSR